MNGSFLARSLTGSATRCSGAVSPSVPSMTSRYTCCDSFFTCSSSDSSASMVNAPSGAYSFMSANAPRTALRYSRASAGV